MLIIDQLPVSCVVIPDSAVGALLDRAKDNIIAIHSEKLFRSIVARERSVSIFHRKIVASLVYV